jgi:hypothetical protein
MRKRFVLVVGSPSKCRLIRPPTRGKIGFSISRTLHASSFIPVFTPRSYGAKADAQTVTDASLTSGQSVLTSATGIFAPTDIGKSITVNGAVSGGFVLITTVAGYLSPTQVTLASSATSTVASATVTWGTDDTIAIQSALNAAATAPGSGHVFVGPLGTNTYLISSALTINSNTTLEFDPAVTIRLRAQANTNMLVSSGFTTGTRSNDIEILGGNFNRPTPNGGTNNGLHSIVMRNVDRLHMAGQSHTSGDGKYALYVVGCRDSIIEDQWCNSTFSDGIHLGGGNQRVTVSNVYGSAGDDLCTLLNKDNPAYLFGDETDNLDVSISDVYGNNTSKCIVKVLGGSSLNTKHIYVNGVYGSSQFKPVWIGDDSTYAQMVGGVMDDITLQNVKARGGSNNNELIQLNPSNGKRFKFIDINYECGSVTGQAAINVGPGSYSTTTVVDSLEIVGVNFIDGAANTGFLNVRGTINNLVITEVAGSPVANANIVRFDGGAANATISRCLLTAVACTWATVSGSAVRADQTGHVLTTLELANVYVKNVAFLLDLNQTVNVFLTATTCDQQLLNARANSVVTLNDPSWGAGAKAVTNAGTVNFRQASKANPSFSSSITPIASQGRWQTITATGAGIFTINAPTFPPGSADTADLTIEINNTSGGALGAITWNAIFKLVGGAFTSPATGNKRFIRFEWNGSAWVEIARASADYT